MLLPGATVLARAVASARDRAGARLHRALSDATTLIELVVVLHRLTRDPVEVLVERGEPPWGDLVPGHVLAFFGGWQFGLWIELARPGRGETRSLAPVDGALQLLFVHRAAALDTEFLGLVVELRARPPLRPVRPRALPAAA